MKISSTCSSQYGSDLGTGGHIEVFAKQNEVLSCRTEALIEELAAERVSLSSAERFCLNVYYLLAIYAKLKPKFRVMPY